jgi:hypothetical protein
VGPVGPAGPAGPTEELILIQGDTFDYSALPSQDWVVLTNQGSTVSLTNSMVWLETTPNIGTGEAIVHGTRQASLADGALIFKSRVMDAYVDQGIYGNAQPRGLAYGRDLNNSITFINQYPTPNTVGCRTTSGGVSTVTTVDTGQSVRSPKVYQIVAKPAEARFYINGQLRCTHTSNLPATPLNIYFGTSDSGAGNVPVGVDYVFFERRQ